MSPESEIHPPRSVLGNCAGTRDTGTGLRAFTATCFIRDVVCCPDGTGAMVPCPSLDHTQYARWIPVHPMDTMALPMKHPGVAREFGAGNFTVRKTKNVFSSIPIDQAHEQNNALIKGVGGAVGLTDNPSALLRWMIAGPEVARAIEEFRDGHEHWGRREDTRHHDQTPNVQTAFTNDVRALVSVIEELGNPFEEGSMDLIVLDTKEIAVLLQLRLSGM